MMPASRAEHSGKLRSRCHVMRRNAIADETMALIGHDGSAFAVSDDALHHKHLSTKSTRPRISAPRADCLRMNIDLHCHSTASDGGLSPAEVVARARRNGVALLALTDHDELLGLDEARSAAGGGLQLLPGVEISVTFEDETIHIVGLDVDPDDPHLLDGLARNRSGRDERARRIGDELARRGIRDALAGAQRFVSNPRLVSRSHFARHLVDIGLMPDVHTVFDHYLAAGKPGYVPHRWARLDEALDWITQAGGVAVLAHPLRYRRLSKSGFRRLLNAFVSLGGSAIEVVAGAQTPDDVVRSATLARRYGMAASVGSDFHDPAESAIDVGCCRDLPEDLKPVWTRWLP